MKFWLPELRTFIEAFNDKGVDLARKAVALDLEMKREREQWVSDLRAEGVKAAHPDDGWVDRDENVVTFCYPQFNDHPADGDLIALGWPPGILAAETRLVRVVETIEPGRRYRFEGIS